MVHKSNSRFQEVINTFEKYGFGQFFKGKRKTKESLKESPEKRLRKTFETLGGGFVLAGIFLAHRVDLIPPSYCKELNRIKDKAIPISFSEVEQTIIKDFSRPVNTVFEKMWPKHVQSDTLTQIHKAKLINGKIIFVKVIKEKNIKLVEDDIIIAKYLAEEVKDPNLKKIIKEFTENFSKKKTLKAERIFLKNSAQAYGSDYLPIPEEQLCTDKVLIFAYEKNKLKSENKYKQVIDATKKTKIELITLITAVTMLILTMIIFGTTDNTIGIISIILIIIATGIIIGNKISKFKEIKK